MITWTPEEVTFLIKHYQELGPLEISKQLNRTMKGVSKKARSLGLSRGIAAGNIARSHTWQFTEWSYDLGYIVGVYLGDGNLFIQPNQTAYFRLAVIDKDFCEAVANKLEKLVGLKGNIHLQTREGIKPQWVYTLCNKDFVYWLRDNFGGPKAKRLQVLPDMEANKGMLEGLMDSEGTHQCKYSLLIRMAGDLKVIETICNLLCIERGSRHQGVSPQKWSSTPNFAGYVISKKEWARVGLGSYIKRKAKDGIPYKQ